MTKKDKAELADLIGRVVDDRVEKALEARGDGEKRARKIIRPDDPPLPTADDLLGHALAPIFRVGVIRLVVETYYDDDRGQVIRYSALRVDKAEMKPMVLPPSDKFEDVLEMIAKAAADLPAHGIKWDPRDPSTQPLTEDDKDRIRKGYRREIDRRFQARATS